ncbi:hypothetical protein [Anabaena azotica]|uniref:Uncharacterized protein n=1 Tax=Anabaena azotica FACHB-119 TaxID=947527 RepID=A0ABR8D4Q8_9NOST|nr:hypothetical protein [Anabaena azotica]MBD2502154.1 hypothetical protein [Anabaena azotica FACHB-119]
MPKIEIAKFCRDNLRQACATFGESMKPLAHADKRVQLSPQNRTAFNRLCYLFDGTRKLVLFRFSLPKSWLIGKGIEYIEQHID